jgi:hypothetical protein
MEGVAPAEAAAVGACCCCCLLVALGVAHPTTAVAMRTLTVLLLTFTAALATLVRVQEEAGEVDASLIDTCLFRRRWNMQSSYVHTRYPEAKANEWSSVQATT